MRWLLQGDSWSPVGFCLEEVPLGLMLSKTRGYMLGEGSKRELKLTPSLFIDDLKTYQNSHGMQEMVNKVLKIFSLV